MDFFFPDTNGQCWDSMAASTVRAIAHKAMNVLCSKREAQHDLAEGARCSFGWGHLGLHWSSDGDTGGLEGALGQLRILALGPLLLQSRVARRSVLGHAPQQPFLVLHTHISLL